MADSAFKLGAYAVVGTVVAMWMQVSYPLFGPIVQRLDRLNIGEKTQAVLAVAVTVTIQITVLGTVLMLLW